MKKYQIILTFVFAFICSTVFSQTVYITKSGKKYHEQGCRYLSKSSSEININDAINQGYTPCKICKPAKKVKTQNVSQKNTLKSSSEIKTSTVQCSATTKKGTRCKRMTKSPNGFCWQHGGK